MTRQSGRKRPLTLATLFAGIAVLFSAIALVNSLFGSNSGGASGDAENIRSYLLENPEVIAEAIDVLRNRASRAEETRMEDAAQRRWGEISTDSHSPVIGPEDAAVTVVEFYDYQCGFCRRNYPHVVKLLEEHGDSIRYVFKQFPVLDSPGEQGPSHLAARAAVVAGRSGEDTFRSFHDALMTRSGGLDANKIFALAEESGLDAEQLKRDMFAPSIERYIAETMMVARSLGVSGTPTYFINGRVVAGAKGYDALADAVETALEKG